jgi:hypothetical protein
MHDRGRTIPHAPDCSIRSTGGWGFLYLLEAQGSQYPLSLSLTIYTYNLMWEPGDTATSPSTTPHKK